ncbi:MAG: 2'-5' RNA ligase family protein, partial [Candidatus Paceibacteria bacterium]
LKTIAENYESFDIHLTEIAVGPDEQRPRMIWAKGPLSEKLLNLHKAVAEAIEKTVGRKETHPFQNHITLARADRSKLRPFREEIDLIFRTTSFELMESTLSPNGAEYRVIESFELKSVGRGS